MKNDGLMIYFCGEEQCDAGVSFGPAVHPHYVLHIVLSGKGIFQKGAEIYHLEQGDIFLTCPEEMTYYEADEYDPWHYAWVAFYGSEVRKLLPKMHLSDYPVFSVSGDLDTYFSHVRQIQEVFKSRDCQQMTLIGNLLSLLSPAMKRTDTAAVQTKEGYVEAAKEYMRNNYSYDVRIHEVADCLKIDRSYLYRLFMELEGISPRQYLVQYRLEVAKAMLENGSYRIREISYSCGFSDIPSFETYFIEQEGMSPEAYMWKHAIRA